MPCTGIRCSQMLLRRCGRRDTVRAFDGNADRPDKPEEFATHRRHDLLFAFAFRDQTAVPLVQPTLCLPCDFLDLGTYRALPLAQRRTDRRSMSVRPPSLDDDSAKVGVAGL